MSPPPRKSKPAEAERALEHLALAVLTPYARNSRTHSPEQVAQIAASIREFGFTNPVLIDEANGIIAGHGRVLAASELGLTTIPCLRLSHLSEAQKRAYVIADNKLALNAGWDSDMLRLELDDLDAAGFDLGLVGFSEEELADLFREAPGAGNTDPDDAPPPPPDPVSRAGDMWILGVHRVRCGDSTVLDDVDALMGGLRADACWTDPPYNVDYESKLAGKIKNDSMADESFRAFLTDAMVSAFQALKPGAPIYVAHADTEGLNFRAAFKAAGLKLSGCLVWVKNALVLGRSDYQWQHEPILYGWRPGAAHRWYGGRRQTTVVQPDSSALNDNGDGSFTLSLGAETYVVRGSEIKVEPVHSSVIRVEKPSRSADHPTMKPVALVTKLLENSTRAGDIVLDLFGGSGSTLISCEMTGRQARLMELDPRFCDVIVRRWQDFTGRAAVLDGDGRPFADVASGRGVKVAGVA